MGPFYESLNKRYSKNNPFLRHNIGNKFYPYLSNINIEDEDPYDHQMTMSDWLLQKYFETTQLS